MTTAKSKAKMMADTPITGNCINGSIVFRRNQQPTNERNARKTNDVSFKGMKMAM